MSSRAPKTDPLSIPESKSGRTVLVPGFIAGAEALHKRFGKLRFARLFEPAISRADEGIEIDAQLDAYFRISQATLQRLPEARSATIMSDGSLYRRDDRWRQPELAQTLRQVASQGAAYMYSGEWAKKFVALVRREGGQVTLDDLRQYKAAWPTPLQTTFRNCAVFAPGRKSGSGVNLVEALQLVELADLRRHGRPEESAESLFDFIQILNCRLLSDVSAEEAKSLFGRDQSHESRANQEASRWMWNQIRSGAWPFSPAASATTRQTPTPHTAGVVVDDRFGNMTALTHSSNSSLWGETGVFVDGVSIPDSASFQQAEMKRAGPGRRLPNDMVPVIVLCDGKPVLGSSAIGGGLHEKTVGAIVDVLEFKIDPVRAARAPALLLPTWNDDRPAAQVEKGAFPQAIIETVQLRGQRVQILSTEDADAFQGYWVGIHRDPDTRTLRGGSAEPDCVHAN